MLEQLIKCPRAGAVYGYATSGTPVVYEVPAAWKASRIIFEAVTASLDINFGTSAGISCTYGQASTLAGAALTVNAATGAHVPAGTAIPVNLDADITHFAIAAEMAGKWRGWKADIV